MRFPAAAAALLAAGSVLLPATSASADAPQDEPGDTAWFTELQDTDLDDLTLTVTELLGDLIDQPTAILGTTLPAVDGTVDAALTVVDETVTQTLDVVESTTDEVTTVVTGTLTDVLPPALPRPAPPAPPVTAPAPRPIVPAPGPLAAIATPGPATANLRALIDAVQGRTPPAPAGPRPVREVAALDPRIIRATPPLGPMAVALTIVILLLVASAFATVVARPRVPR